MLSILLEGAKLCTFLGNFALYSLEQSTVGLIFKGQRSLSFTSEIPFKILDTNLGTLCTEREELAGRNGKATRQRWRGYREAKQVAHATHFNAIEG